MTYGKFSDLWTVNQRMAMHFPPKPGTHLILTNDGKPNGFDTPSNARWYHGTAVLMYDAWRRGYDEGLNDGYDAARRY